MVSTVNMLVISEAAKIDELNVALNWKNHSVGRNQWFLGRRMLTGTLHFFTTLLWKQEGEGNAFDLVDYRNGQVEEEDIKRLKSIFFHFYLGLLRLGTYNGQISGGKNFKSRPTDNSFDLRRSVVCCIRLDEDKALRQMASMPTSTVIAICRHVVLLKQVFKLPL